MHFNNNKERRGGDGDIFFLKGEGKKKGEKTTPRKEDSTRIAERGDRMLKKTNNEVDLKTRVSKKKNQLLVVNKCHCRSKKGRAECS